jgi:hypothetical protein
MKQNHLIEEFVTFFYFVPESHLEQTKQAIFEAGAGSIGNYSCCCWQTKGMGQFRAEVNSNPYLGKIGEITSVVEYRVETVCPGRLRNKVLEALKKSHPYEVPAYGFIKLESI